VLEQAQTPYFIWLAGHDIWHPQLLEKLLKAFDDSKDENIILTFPKFQINSKKIYPTLLFAYTFQLIQELFPLVFFW
jgi:hypothetical protein